MNQGLSRNYSLKAHIERIFGNKRFLQIKDYPSLITWKKTLVLMIKSYKKSINQSIKVAPITFENDISDIYSHYDQLINRSTSEEELFSTIVAFQSELIYSLLGTINHYEDRTLSSSWDLSSLRETQIVQTKNQYYKEIECKVYKKFSMKQIEEFSREKREIHNKDDFFLWIYKNKMNNGEI